MKLSPSQQCRHRTTVLQCDMFTQHSKSVRVYKNEYRWWKSGLLKVASRRVRCKRNKFVFGSFLRTLTTWHCPHSPAAAAVERRLYSNRSISPARRAHSSKPAAAGLLLWAHASLVRRTDTVHRPCSAYYSDSTNKRVASGDWEILQLSYVITPTSLVIHLIYA